MRERLIEDEHGRKWLVAAIENQKLPFTVKVTEGKMRSYEQNQLQWLWATEAAEHRKDISPPEVQAEWKLNFGIPIMCMEDEEFARVWARVDNKLSYSEQLDLMHCVPVTRLMTTRQLANYLDQVYQHNAEHGIELTDPEDLRWDAKDSQRVAGKDTE